MKEKLEFYLKHWELLPNDQVQRISAKVLSLIDSEKLMALTEEPNDEKMKETTKVCAERVMNESDPILREIWAEGYTHIEECAVHGNIKLIDVPNDYIKVIDLHYFREVTSTLTFKKGLMPDGSIHRWVADGDGSAVRLRDVIKNLQSTSS